jgi:hypothetical protein
MVPPYVRGEEPLHPPAQVPRFPRPGDQVEVIGHQAPGHKTHRDPLVRLPEQLQKRHVIGVMKHLVPTVPPIEDMVAGIPGRRFCRGDNMKLPSRYSSLT